MFPDQRRMNEMAVSSGFTARAPEAWYAVSDQERQHYLQWAERLDQPVADYETLFSMNSANHANFIAPRYFLEQEGQTVPYSIAPTAHLCSCCVELFGILGREFPRLLVRPCSGAVLFARLTPDAYLEVCQQ